MEGKAWQGGMIVDEGGSKAEREWNRVWNGRVGEKAVMSKKKDN